MHDVHTLGLDNMPCAGVTAGVGQQRAGSVPPGRRLLACFGCHAGRPAAHSTRLCAVYWAGGLLTPLHGPTAAFAGRLGYPVSTRLPPRYAFNQRDNRTT